MPSTSTIIGTDGIAQQGDDSIALYSSWSSSKPWIVDSGAFNHITGDRHLFDTFSPFTSPLSVQIVNGTCPKVVGMGTIQLP